jgi:hypothetical protein
MDIQITINVNAGPEDSTPEDTTNEDILKLPGVAGRAKRAPGMTSHPILDMIGL